MKLKLNNYSILLPFLALLFTGCDKEDEGKYERIPERNVNREVNINDPYYTSLNHKGGYIYLDEGFKGVILAKSYDGDFIALERACPYEPKKDCAKVTVDSSNVYIRCGHYGSNEWIPCCNSKYNLKGHILEGPSQKPLKTYNIQKDGSIVQIRN